MAGVLLWVGASALRECIIGVAVCFLGPQGNGWEGRVAAPAAPD